jgi:hypothetical protein
MPDELVVPKQRRQVRLWIHPEGRVVGSLFVRAATEGEPEQRIVDALNEEQPFIVLMREEPEELRFYHRASILRVESDSTPPSATTGEPVIEHRCELGMMDGSFISGTLTRPSPPDRSRLFDFLNRGEERFLEVFLADGATLVINKAYVIFVRPTGEER